MKPLHLYLLGAPFESDRPLRRYIDRHLSGAGLLSRQTILQRRAEGIFGASRPTDEGRIVLVFYTPEHAASLAREIAEHLGTGIETDGEKFTPSGAEKVDDSYYRIVHDATEIHALAAYPGCRLSPLQLREKHAVVHVFEADRAGLEARLEAARETFRIRHTLTEAIPGWAECRLEAERFGDVDGAVKHLLAHYPKAVAANEIALWLIQKLERTGKCITFAESCTGGLLSYFFTKESGASGVFEGALVTYSNRLKSAWIDVSKETLTAHGAVSREVVEAMSAGALKASGADYAVAVSGIAGPTGGTPEKPVGTVHVAVRGPHRFAVARLQLDGDRNYIQEQTVLHAIKMLILLDKATFLHDS